jgi:hypothetical protein
VAILRFKKVVDGTFYNYLAFGYFSKSWAIFPPSSGHPDINTEENVPLGQR